MARSLSLALCSPRFRLWLVSPRLVGLRVEGSAGHRGDAGTIATLPRRARGNRTPVKLLRARARDLLPRFFQRERKNRATIRDYLSTGLLSGCGERRSARTQPLQPR